MIVYDTTYAGMAAGLSQRLLSLAPQLSAYGFNAVKYPPTDNTHNPYSLGYDPRSHLDWGQWEPLHITGSAQDLKNSIDACHANGLFAIKDWVRRQMSATLCLERNANGKYDQNLFPKTPRCFVPMAKRDNTYDPTNGSDDGNVISYLDTQGYMLNGVIQSAMLADKIFGWDGFRQDEGKGFAISVLRRFSQLLRTNVSYSEMYSADQNECADYILKTNFPILDFLLHFLYRNVSNGGSLTQLAQSTIAMTHPEKAFVYVESNDTDGPNGIVNNKLWFYLHALTMPCKAAMVYAGDYEKYGLAKFINNIVWFADLIRGPRIYEYVDDTTIAWSNSGDGGTYGKTVPTFCGFSSEPIVTKYKWLHTQFYPGQRIHDYSGHYPDLTVNSDRWCQFEFLPNYFGSAQNYFMYAPADLEHTVLRPPVGKTGTGNFYDFSSITVKLPQGF